MPPHTRFIVNPRAGRRGGVLEQVRAHARRTGASVVVTERARHAHTLAAAALADGCSRIIAVGGDGTMNEVASALVNTPAAFGLVPCGSGDGLGRTLGLHGPIARALVVVEAGGTRLIDSGLADGHPFFAVAGLGFEAELAARFNRLERRGLARYLIAGLASYARAGSQEYRVGAGGPRQTLTAFTVAVANAAQYGNNVRIAPLARLDDGLLDLCALPKPSRLGLLPLLLRLVRGTIPGCPGMTTRQAERFVIERPSAGPIHTDGEVHAAGVTVEFSVRRASLRVIVPAGHGSD